MYFDESVKRTVAALERPKSGARAMVGSGDTPTLPCERHHRHFQGMT